MVVDSNFWPPAESFLDITDVPQLTDGRARCTAIAVCDPEGRATTVFYQGQTALFFYEFELLADVRTPAGGVEFCDESGTVIHGKNMYQYELPCLELASAGTRLRYCQRMTLALADGKYRLSVGLASSDPAAYAAYCAGQISHRQFSPLLSEVCRVVQAGEFVVLETDKLSHHGLVDLSGGMTVAVLQDHRTASEPASPLLRIIVTEYPKSGASWVCSMLGTALGLQTRDIYSRRQSSDSPQAVPWALALAGPDIRAGKPYVIKSHEVPNSSLIDFPARFVHLLRDGRDVVVSKFFYEKDFCVNNGIYKSFDTPFDTYVVDVAAEWRSYVGSWLDTDVPWHKYESFLEDPVSSLQSVVMGLGLRIPEVRIKYAVMSNTKEKFSRSLDSRFKSNTFVRKGISGDWRNHFGPDHVRAFKEVAGDMLIRLGYERDLDW